MDDFYDFVAISEYYYESLVLLREQLCLPWTALYVEDRMVSSTYEKVDFTLKQKKNLKLFFQQDEAIYNYFNASFWKKVENYGIKRMEKDVKRLKRKFTNHIMDIESRTPRRILN